MNRPVRWYDYLTVNVNWLGMSSLSQTMTPLVAPLLIQQFVGESAKGTFYGTLRLVTMMIALLVQALMGMLSDQSTSRWGRRRPFIFIGTVANIVVLVMVGLSAAMEGMAGYFFLFAMSILSAIAGNTVQGAQQGLITDLVPEEKHGRFSSIKAILEIPLPVILISLTVGQLIKNGNMWGGILVVIGIMAVCLILTLFVPERQNKEPVHLNWKPFVQLIVMTLVFAAIIVGMGYLSGIGQSLIPQSTSPITLAIITGAIALAGMAVAVGLGVWSSVHLGVGADIKKNPSFTWWVVNRLAFLVGANNLASFVVYFLQGRLGLVREKAAGPGSILTMFVGVFILFCALPSGWLTDRLGHKRMITLAGLIAALGTLVALSAPSLPVIYAGGAIIGAAMGLFYTANWALGTSLVPQNQAGKYLGISNLAGAGAGAIGAYIGGPMADFITRSVPDQPGLGYVVLFAVYGILFLASIAALIGVKSNPKGSKDAPVGSARLAVDDSVAE